MSNAQETTPPGGGTSTIVRDLVDSIADHDAPTTTTATGTKVCCACGVNVAGKTRYKDAQGQYWCYECGMEDHVRKHPEAGVPCDSCHEKVCPTKLTQVGANRLCPACNEKVVAQQKRDTARHARAEAEAREAEASRKRMIAVGSAVAAAVVMGGILYAVM